MGAQPECHTLTSQAGKLAHALTIHARTMPCVLTWNRATNSCADVQDALVDRDVRKHSELAPDATDRAAPTLVVLDINVSIMNAMEVVRHVSNVRSCEDK